MKTIWKRKWLVMALTIAIVLLVGTTAWAAAGEGNTAGSAVSGGQGAAVAGTGVCQGGLGTECSELGDAVRKTIRDKAGECAERQAKLMEVLRGDMSPEDQALYDELVETVKSQRETLQEARENLQSTLAQIRDLVDGYLDDES